MNKKPKLWVSLLEFQQLTSEDRKRWQIHIDLTRDQLFAAPDLSKDYDDEQQEDWTR